MTKSTACVAALLAATAIAGCSSDRTVVRRETTRTVPVEDTVTRRTTVETVPAAPVVETETTRSSERRTTVETDD